MNQPPSLYIAVTSHGFGHAVRAASVAAVIKQLMPQIRIIFVTTAPDWLIASYVGQDFTQRWKAFDVGVIQSDSITMDKAATLAKMQYFQLQQQQIIAEEVEFIHKNQVKLILSDISPLAAPIAQAAGIPCWMMGNFGWDFIYRYWGEEFESIADWIGDCYSQCDHLFRLPLSEPMKAFSTITEVGLTGGTPRYPEKELRDKFNLTKPRERTILLTFGGLGLQAIPYDNLSVFPAWDFITFDRHAPDIDNLIKIRDNHYRPVDFMPLSGKVISKPGYSTFAEALRLDVPIVSLTREDFAESPLLLEGIKNHSWHQILNPVDFFRGNWCFLQESLKKPRSTAKLAKNGTETIAKKIVEFYQT